MVKFVLGANIFRISMLLWLQVFCDAMKKCEWTNLENIIKCQHACLKNNPPLKLPSHSTLEIFKNSQSPYKDSLNLPEVYDIASRSSLHLGTY